MTFHLNTKMINHLCLLKFYAGLYLVIIRRPCSSLLNAIFLLDKVLYDKQIEWKDLKVALEKCKIENSSVRTLSMSLSLNFKISHMRLFFFCNFFFLVLICPNKWAKTVTFLCSKPFDITYGIVWTLTCVLVKLIWETSPWPKIV